MAITLYVAVYLTALHLGLSREGHLVGIGQPLAVIDYSSSDGCHGLKREKEAVESRDTDRAFLNKIYPSHF